HARSRRLQRSTSRNTSVEAARYPGALHRTQYAAVESAASPPRFDTTSLAGRNRPQPKLRLQRSTRSERLLMTPTDAKQLVRLAERMGIPTEDAVQRVVMRMIDRPLDIQIPLRSSSS